MSQVKTLPEFRVYGQGDVTVFMFHGAYGNGRYFENTANILAENGYRVVVWHAPGYGDEAPPEDFTIDVAGEAAQQLVEAQGTEKNVLLGHSMGALIAPNAAQKLGDSVDGIILSGASVGFQNRSPEDQERFLKERIAPIQEDGMTVAEYSPKLLKTMMAPDSEGPLVDKVVEVVSDMKTETFIAAMGALVSYNSDSAVEAINVPTLLLSGEYDTACPPAGMEILHSKIGGSEYQMIKDAGHYAFAEQPDVFHQHVLDFLNRKFKSN